MDTIEIIWVSVFVGAGFIFSWLAAFGGHNNDNLMIGAPICMILAAVFAWDNAITELFLKVVTFIPNPENELAISTAILLTGLIVIAVMLSIIFSPFLFMDTDGKISAKNFLKAFKKG